MLEGGEYIIQSKKMNKNGPLEYEQEQLEQNQQNNEADSLYQPSEQSFSIEDEPLAKELLITKILEESQKVKPKREEEQENNMQFEENNGEGHKNGEGQQETAFNSQNQLLLHELQDIQLSKDELNLFQERTSITKKQSNKRIPSSSIQVIINQALQVEKSTALLLDQIKKLVQDNPSILPKQKVKKAKLNGFASKTPKKEDKQKYDIGRSSLSLKMQGKPSRKYPNNDRERLQKEIAYVFITKGYGLTVAKQYTERQIQGNKYNSTLTSIIRAALRKLQHILNNTLGKKVKNFDAKEERLLRSPLVNCRKWLARNDLNAFFKLIKLVYEINPEPIYQDEVLSLYDKIMKQLNKRTLTAGAQPKPKNKQKNNVIIESKTRRSNPVSVQSPADTIKQHLNNNRQEKNNNVGNSSLIKYQKEIVELFIKFKTVHSVLLILSRKYKQMVWKQQDLQQTITKLIKIGLKKILKFRKEYVMQNVEIPTLTLNEHLVTQIIESPLAQQTRAAIVKSLLESTLNLTRVQQLVGLVNQTLEQITN